MGKSAGMRVTLLHNSSAGSKDHTADELVACIHAAGHEVLLVARSVADLLGSLRRQPPDLIAVAGGDGTVGTVACALAGSPFPLAILPLGTANNTALALGVRGEVNDIVQTWQQGRVLAFDIGTAREAGGSRRFGEAVGWGVLPALIAAGKGQERQGGGKGRVGDEARSVRGERELFRAMAERLPARHYAIDVDGEDRSGDYLLVEVMNVPFAGPQLQLSPTSNPDDGRIELILVTDQERAALVALTEVEPGASAPILPSFAGAHVSVRSADDYHVDGKLMDDAVPTGGRHHVELSVQRAAVRYLVS